jgi:hypothetical protein
MTKEKKTQVTKCAEKQKQKDGNFDSALEKRKHQAIKLRSSLF